MVKKRRSTRKSVEIFTDGSYKKELHTGGWCSLLVFWPHWKLITDSAYGTTINRMELLGVIRGLEELTEPCNVLVVSDSKYTVNIINFWIYNWYRRNWTLGSSGEPVKNLDLVIRLYDLMHVHKVRAEWVRAHTINNDYWSNANRVCDYYAQNSAEHHFDIKSAHAMPLTSKEELTCNLIPALNS